MSRLKNAEQIKTASQRLVIAEVIAERGDSLRQAAAVLRADKYRAELRALLEVA